VTTIDDDAGPKLTGSLPLIGHLARMRRDPLATLVAASRLGDVTRIDLGPRGEAYVVTHPDGVKRVLLGNQPNYSRRTRGFDSLRLFLGQGLQQRRIAQHRGGIFKRSLRYAPLTLSTLASLIPPISWA
jgi:cytochrome P450